MFGDDCSITLKKFRYLSLCQPNRFIFQTYFQFNSFVWLIKYNFSLFNRGLLLYIIKSGRKKIRTSFLPTRF